MQGSVTMNRERLFLGSCTVAKSSGQALSSVLPSFVNLHRAILDIMYVWISRKEQDRQIPS